MACLMKPDALKETLAELLTGCHVKIKELLRNHKAIDLVFVVTRTVKDLIATQKGSE